MKNWKKGMIAGSIICIATGFLFIGIGSSMGGWKNIDKINSRYIHFGGSDTFIGLNFPANTKESIQILSRETDGPADVGSTSTGEVISFNGKLPEEMEISANTLALKIVPGKSDAIILSGSNRDKMNCYIEDNCLYLEEKNHKPIQGRRNRPDGSGIEGLEKDRNRCTGGVCGTAGFFGGGNGIFGRSGKH